VLDYKTSDSPVNPAKAHLRTATDPDKVAWAVVEVQAKPQEWIDLQLPLYERAVAAIYPGEVITCGYFNLPKAVTETNVELWEDYDKDLASAAWTCVEGVTSAIMASEFWPPRELRGRELDWDDFSTMFHNGAEESVDCENLTAAKPEVAS
jgi:ATP-dependent helicase/nuclease subunit B